MKRNSKYKTEFLLCFDDIKLVVNRHHALVGHFHVLVKQGSAKRQYKKMKRIVELFISSLTTYTTQDHQITRNTSTWIL
jgi:hypothetical protein